MSTSKPDKITPLRLQAEGLLQDGNAPKAKIAMPGVKALALLHSMATNPAQASDALKLLHELQVHQVELDLQHEQFEQSHNELSRVLDRYVEAYDFAPFAYVTVDHDGKIMEGNRAAAELFGVEHAALSGRHIDNLVTSEYRLAIRSLLKRLGSHGARETCKAQVISGSVTRNADIVATASPAGQYFMLACIETTSSLAG